MLLVLLGLAALTAADPGLLEPKAREPTALEPAALELSATASVSIAPEPGLDLEHLERIVRARSPLLRAADGDAEVARAGEQQASLFLNPALDLGVGTLPLGETNPPNLPFSQVPNYAVGLSYTFLLGKRGPNQERAAATRSSIEWSRDALARNLAIQLADTLGRVAALTLRRAGLVDLMTDAERAVGLAELRFESKFASPLDVDRLRIDLSRTMQQIRSLDSDLDQVRSSCAALVGARCGGFEDAAAAQAFFSAWLARQPERRALELRADLKSLADAERSALAESTLAGRQAIPDPTVRLGYVHDTFIASGAQANSLNVSLSLPLPIFDHGQAADAAAQAKASSLRDQLARLRDAAGAKIPLLARRLALQLERRRVLTEETLPAARRVLNDVTNAVDKRLLPLTDLLQARRALSELLLDESDSYLDAFEALLGLYAELPAPRAQDTQP